MSNSCPFPKSTAVTDVLVDCETNILSVIQTDPAGNESTQSVDLTCIVPPRTRLTSAVYDCDNDQLILTQETEGDCTGAGCIETFVVNMSCIRDGLMPSCDNLVSVSPTPVGSELVVCTVGGAFKTPVEDILPSLDCGNLTQVCCPRPPTAEFIVCNEGGLARLPASDVFTCDDIPAAAGLSSNPSVVVCGDAGMEKVPVSAIQLNCADFTHEATPPAGAYIVACDGGNFITIPQPQDRLTDVVGGEGIDVGVINGADTDTFTITFDACDLTSSTYEDLSDPGPVYMVVCAAGQNYKIPYVEAAGSTLLSDGAGTSLSGTGAAGDPYIVDLAICELTEELYDPAATTAVCIGTDTKRMPAIKAGTNVTIDTDGTLNADVTVEGLTQMILPVNQITLWDVSFTSGTDPNHAATVTVSSALGVDYSAMIVDISMEGYLSTQNSSGALETIELKALIEGVEVAKCTLVSPNTGLHASNQWRGHLVLPYDGGNDVDVALNWATVGAGTAIAEMDTKAVIIGRIT